jgi:hypothetical protein
VTVCHEAVECGRDGQGVGVRDDAGAGQREGVGDNVKKVGAGLIGL